MSVVATDLLKRVCAQLSTTTMLAKLSIQLHNSISNQASRTDMRRMSSCAWAPQARAPTSTAATDEYHMILGGL